MDNSDDRPAQCPLPLPLDLTSLIVVNLGPEQSPQGLDEALRMANAQAAARLGDSMLLSWYDRDRDFEAPQHISECHEKGAVPGYVDYAVHRGAHLKVDIEQGRFVFFYLKI